MSLAESLTDYESKPVEAEEVTEELEATAPDEAEAAEDEGGDEAEDVVYDIDGQEVTKDQIEQWKLAFEREQENTNNGTDLGKLKESLEAKSQQIDETLTALSAAESEIQSLVLGDLEEIDLKSLREEDYQEYLRTKELIDERKKQFQDIKDKAMAARSQKLSEEQKVLVQSRGWSDSAKKESDLKLLDSVIKDNDFTAEDVRTLTSAKVMSVLLEAAKMKQEIAEIKKPKKKVVKVPTSVKAKGKSDAGKSLADRLFSD